MNRPTPDPSRPLPGGAFVRVLSVPLLGGVRRGFMVLMHGVKVVGLHEREGQGEGGKCSVEHAVQSIPGRGGRGRPRPRILSQQ